MGRGEGRRLHRVACCASRKGCDVSCARRLTCGPGCTSRSRVANLPGRRVRLGGQGADLADPQGHG